MADPKPEQSTNKPKSPKPTDDSSCTNSNGGDDEQETVPTTWSGSLGTASVKILQLFMVNPIFSQKLLSFFNFLVI